MSAGESCLRGTESGFPNPPHEKGDPSMLANGLDLKEVVTYAQLFPLTAIFAEPTRYNTFSGPAGRMALK